MLVTFLFYLQQLNMSIVKSPLDLSADLQISDCISKGTFTTSYLGYGKNDFMKKVIKIIDLRQLQKSQLTVSVKVTNSQLTKIQMYYKRKFGYKTLSSIPKQKLELVSLESNKKIKFLTRDWIPGHSFYHAIVTGNEELLDSISVMEFIKQQLSMQISYGGVKQHILTSTNIYIDQFLSMQMNATSMVGARFLLTDQVISKHQFFEIFSYLDSGILKRQNSKKYNSKMKIRAIVVNLLKLILKQQFNLIQDRILDNYFARNNRSVQLMIQQAPRMFGNFLANQRVKKAIEREQKLRQQSESDFNKSLNLQNLFHAVLVQQSLFNKKAFKINESEIWLYDDFLNSWVFPKGQTLNKQLNAEFQLFHNQLWQTESKDTKGFYTSRSLDTLQTYFLTKLNLPFHQILNYQFWYENITAASNPNNRSLVLDRNNRTVRYLAYMLANFKIQIFNHEKLNKTSKDEGQCSYETLATKKSEGSEKEGESTWFSSNAQPKSQLLYQPKRIAKSVSDDQVYQRARQFIKNSHIVERRVKESGSHHNISQLVYWQPIGKLI